MPWSGRFISELVKKTIEPRYLFESVDVAGWRPMGGSLSLSSFPCAGFIEEISRRGSSITYPELRPITWERSHGSLTLALRGQRDIRPFTTRGQTVQLRVGFPGWAPDEFEPVWVGMVRNVSMRGNRWVLEAVDLVASLASRFDTSPQQQALFHIIPNDGTTLTTAYDPSSDTEVHVADVTGFGQSDTEQYVLRIHPSSGDPYYVSATGRTGNDFTGLTDSRFNTTSVAASSGDRVYPIAFTSAHPVRIAQRLLLSTGTANQHGQYDILPASWSWGLHPGLVDEDDCDLHYRLSTASGNPSWAMLVDAQQQDGIGWLQGFLRPGGWFVSQHQGRLTCRAVLSSDVQQTSATVQIHDDDIVEISEYQAYDSAVPIEYGKTRVRAGFEYGTGDWGHETTRPETSIDSRPSRDRYTRDAYGAIASGDDWADEITTRLGSWELRVPERLTLLCRGWHCGHPSVGDIARLNTTLIRPRAYSSGDRYDEYRPALVVGGGIDWFGATTRLSVLTHPAVEQEY